VRLLAFYANVGLVLSYKIDAIELRDIKMGKLTQMVAEESTLKGRIKFNARRVRFAGIGLLCKLGDERSRLYSKVVDASPNRDNDTVVAKLNAISSGAVSIAKQESLRIFDELVAAGEAVDAKPDSSNGKPKAKAQPLKVVETKKAPAKKAVATAAPSGKKKAEHIPEEVKSALLDAKKRIGSASVTPELSDQLLLEALFCQAGDGDVKGRRPAMSKADERAIFDARRELKGMSKVEAIAQYIAKVDKLIK